MLPGDLDIKADIQPEISVPDSDIKADVAANVEAPPPAVEEDMIQAQGVKDVESGFGFSMPGLRVGALFVIQRELTYSVPWSSLKSPSSHDQALYI